MSGQGTTKKVDLESLRKVTDRLQEAVLAYSQRPDDSYILDAVVKRFELTYELSVRSLRRFLLDISISDIDLDELTLQGLIRKGDKEGLLLNGWLGWKDYRDARNDTVHSYHEAKAKEIAATAGGFVREAEYLLASLKRRTEENG